MSIVPMPLPTILRPSIDSCAGSVSNFFDGECQLSRARYNCIVSIALRIVTLLAVTLFTIADIALWTAMTITVYPVCYLGRNHFINLISIVAAPILTLGLLFGFSLPVDLDRRFFSAFSCFKKHPWNENYITVVRRRIREGNLGQEERERALTDAINNLDSITRERDLIEENIKLLLETRINPNAQPGGWSVLGSACGVVHNSRVVKMLLDKHADPNFGGEDLYAGYPLERAVENLSFRSVKLLLQRGALPNAHKRIHPIVRAILGGRSFYLGWEKIGIGERNSLASTRAVIKLLIQTEEIIIPPQCIEKIEKLSNVLHQNINSEESVAREAIHEWVESVKHDAEPILILFRKQIQSGYLENDFTNPAFQVHFRRSRENLLNNIKVTIPIVIQAKKQIIEKYIRMIRESNFLSEQRDLPRLIAEYCYS